MIETRWSRLAPLSGVAFFVLLAVSMFVLERSTPDSTASTASVVSYYDNHSSREMGAAFVGMYAAFFLVWFAGVLRARLRWAEGASGRLSTVSFGGALLIVVGGVTSSGFGFAAADVAGNSNVPGTVVQTLSVLNNDIFLLIGIGTALFLIGAGVASLRYGALPRWLAWAGIVIGVLSVTPAGFFAFMATMVWVLVTAIWMYASQRAVVTAPAPSTS